jgi:hypothetical protein
MHKNYQATDRRYYHFERQQPSDIKELVFAESVSVHRMDRTCTTVLVTIIAVLLLLVL